MPESVAYPGIVGSFSWSAAHSLFPGADLRGFESFRTVAEAALKDADYALLPVENSFAGPVRLTWSLLEELPLYITGEVRKPVRHQLLGLPGAKLEGIRRISSHPQALAQCDRFLSGLRNVELISSPNTALSAREAAEANDPAFAAIASLEAAEAYGLSVLARDVHSSPHNTTRFLLLSRRMEPIGTPSKATVVFRLSHRVGALARLLDSFARSGLNMTRIESRPLPDTPFQYFFSADFEGEMSAGELQAAMAAAEPHTLFLRLLGLYRVWEV